VLRYAFLIPVIWLAGCVTGPDWYAPPAQRELLPVSEASVLRMFIQMNHPNAPAHLVKDISDTVEADSWRWTHRRPELRFYLEKIDDLKFAADFSISGATFEKTGPVVISFFVNDQLLDRVRYTAHGHQKYQRPVPAELLRPFAINRVVIQPDKVWISPHDGVALGVILTEAGFKR
jgi:hypothetical protein